MASFTTQSTAEQRLCRGNTSLSFTRTLLFSLSVVKSPFHMVGDRKPGLRKRQIWHRLNRACACKAVQKQKQQSWTRARKLGSICQLINATGSRYPYVGICTVFIVVISALMERTYFFESKSCGWDLSGQQREIVVVWRVKALQWTQWKIMAPG